MDAYDVGYTNIKSGGGAINKTNIAGLRLMIINDVYNYSINTTSNVAASAELVESMYHYFKNKGKNEPLADTIASHICMDSMATLCLLLQPNKKNGFMYIKDSELSEFVDYFNINSDSGKPSDYSLKDKSVIKYNDIKCKSGPATTSENGVKVTDEFTIDILKKKYKDVKYGNLRDKLSIDEHLAEAELRLISAITLSNSNYKYNEENRYIYVIYSLEKMHMNSINTLNSNIAHKISTIYLMLVSNVSYYTPLNKSNYPNSINNFALGAVDIYKK